MRWGTTAGGSGRMPTFAPPYQVVSARAPVATYPFRARARLRVRFVRANILHYAELYRVVGLHGGVDVRHASVDHLLYSLPSVAPSPAGVPVSTSCTGAPGEIVPAGCRPTGGEVQGGACSGEHRHSACFTCARSRASCLVPRSATSSCCIWHRSSPPSPRVIRPLHTACPGAFRRSGSQAPWTARASSLGWLIPTRNSQR